MPVLRAPRLRLTPAAGAERALGVPRPSARGPAASPSPCSRVKAHPPHLRPSKACSHVTDVGARGTALVKHDVEAQELLPDRARRSAARRRAANGRRPRGPRRPSRPRRAAARARRARVRRDRERARRRIARGIGAIAVAREPARSRSGSKPAEPQHELRDGRAREPAHLAVECAQEAIGTVSRTESPTPRSGNQRRHARASAPRSRGSPAWAGRRPGCRCSKRQRELRHRERVQARRHG
jgi:hypothetical protein